MLSKPLDITFEISYNYLVMTINDQPSCAEIETLLSARNHYTIWKDPETNVWFKHDNCIQLNLGDSILLYLLGRTGIERTCQAYAGLDQLPYYKRRCELAVQNFNKEFCGGKNPVHQEIQTILDDIFKGE